MKKQDFISCFSFVVTQYIIAYDYFLNNVVSVLDPVSKDKKFAFTSKSEYDGADNITLIILRKNFGDAEKTLKKNTYDLKGNVITETDSNGNTTIFEYNALNKVRKAVYPKDETIPENIITNYNYKPV